MTDAKPAMVQRYKLAQRVVHWLGVGSFLILLLSGLALLVPQLAFLAAGGGSRLMHRVAAVGFMLMPLVYAAIVPHEAIELLKESFTYTLKDLKWFRHMPAYVLGSTKGLPPAGRINPGQKIHHAMTFIMFGTVAGSGLMLWFGQASLGPEGLALALTVHDLSMMGLTVLMIGHMYFTFLYGALPAMTTGYVSEEYARMEHADWYETLAAANAAAAEVETQTTA
jgi:formate dehydrogenase subunit gamma